MDVRTTPSLFWDLFAPVYDFATRSGDVGLAEAAAWVASFLDRHDIVLDAACGTGAFACALAPHVGFVAGNDLSTQMVARARATAKRLGLENTAFDVGNICTLDFANETFDAVVAGNILHLLVSPERALSELTRVTRPGGIIALPTYMNAEDQDRRFLWLIEALGFAPTAEWNEAEYLRFLEEQGMTVLEHRSFAAKQPLCVAICRRA